MGNSILEALLGAAALGVAAKVAQKSQHDKKRNEYVARYVSNAYANKWVCPRCGTTNMGNLRKCERCRNLRP